MAEQPTTPTDNKPKASANGVDKTPWTQTPAGRKKLSDNAKAAHAAKPRSTRPPAEDKIKRLNELLTGGATVKEAALLTGMGYSTAQRYASKSKKAVKKSSEAGSKKAKATHGLLSPEKKKMLFRLLPKLGTKLKAQEIADRVGCHLTSVYSYRNKMLGDADSPAVGAAPSPGRGSQLALSDYADLKDVYQTLWRDCFANDVEPTDAEIRFTRVWRRIR